MTDTTKPGIQRLPTEVTDLIVAACIDRQRLNVGELRRIGTVCRSLRYSVLPHIYENLAFLVRDKRWPLFTTFTQFIEAYSSCGRHTKRIVAEVPRDTTVVPPSPLSPASLASLEHLELSNLYLLPAIAAIPTDSPPFPNLNRIRFYAPSRFGARGTPRLEVSVQKLHAIWKSPKLEAVRFMQIDLVPGDTTSQGDLPLVGSLSLSECKIVDAALQQLTSVRPIGKLELQRSTIEPCREAIERIHEIDLGGAASLRGGPQLSLFVDLHRLPLTDEQFHEVSTDGHKLPPGLAELEITVDVVNRTRSNFLKVLYNVIEQQTPALTKLDLTFECQVPRYEGGESESDATPPRFPCDQGDWATGFPRYGEYISYSLSICEPDPDGAVGLRGSENEDYLHFKGYSALKKFCEGKGIALKCEWTVREN